MPPPDRIARRDPSLSATVVARRPLLYDDGPDPAQDRPAFVRAASAAVWLGERLALVQDDAHFLALVDPEPLRVEAVPLPADAQGRRLFDDLRGTKHLKMDLEAALVVPDPGGARLIAFGSGSTPLRERVVLYQVGTAPEVVEAGALYAGLREAAGFSGSELNVEGALLLDGHVRLFNRGNGAPRGGRQPLDATGDLDWPALAAYLRDPSTPPPRVERPEAYDLGALGGVRLTFTDASQTPAGLLYLASAEDSPDAVEDGEVMGSALGVLAEGAPPRWAPLTDPAGTPLAIKAEGLAPSRLHPDRLYVVTDPDDPETPSELCEVVLAGPWSS